MSQHGPVDAFIVIDAVDVSPDVFQLKDRFEQVISLSHGISKSWEESKPVGIGRFILEPSGGFYEDAVLSTLGIYVPSNTATHQVCYGMGGKAIGAEVTLPVGSLEAQVERGPKRDDVTFAEVRHTITGAGLRGRIIHGFTAETTASGDSKASSVDSNTNIRNPPVKITNATVANPTVVTAANHGLVNGDVIFVSGSTTTPTIDGQRTATVVDANTFTVPVNVTSNGGAQAACSFVKLTNAFADWVLHVLALVLDGGTSVTILGLHSVDNSTFTTAVSFTNVTAAGPGATGVQRITQTGPVNRYMAISWVFNGGAGANRSITPLVAAGRY